MKIPEKLEIIEGSSLGEKIQNLTFYLNITASRIRGLEHDLGRKWIKIDEPKHKKERAKIDEHYEKWMTCFEAMLETEIGDWIHGTELWNDFWYAASELHEVMMNLIKDEHELRKRVDETNDTRVANG